MELDPNELHLTLLERLPNGRGLYRCVCGTEKVLLRSNVSVRGTRSCGCLRKQVTRERSTTHGGAAGRLVSYSRWKQMRQRCQPDFEGWGDRGITICERWESYENFRQDMGEPGPGESLERLDNDGNYEPGNCIWASKSVQNNNKRNVIRITHDGRTQSLAQWSREVRVSTFTIRRRLGAGVTGDALFAPGARGPGYGRGGCKTKLQEIA